MSLTPEMDAAIAATRAAVRRLNVERGCSVLALQCLISAVEAVSIEAGPDGRHDLRAFLARFCDAMDVGASTLTPDDLAFCRAARAAAKTVA